jgi:type VI secretion system secreted protein VgrG
MAAASSSVITFEAPPLDKETFRVMHFSGNEALSRPFRFEIRTVVDQGPLDPAEILGKPGHLNVKGDGYSAMHHGVITSIEQTPDNTSYERCFYDIILEPKFILSSYTQESRIYQDKTVLEIAEDIFESCGMTSSEFRSELQDTLPKREFTVQYNESDFDFLSRLLEDEGLFYFFDHSGQSEVLVLADNPQAFKAIENTPKLPFIPDAGIRKQKNEAIQTIKRIDRITTGKVTVRDYNYRTPEANISGTESGTGTGELYIYGAHTKNVDEATRLAKLRQQMLTAEKTVFVGTSNARSLLTGFRFEIDDLTRQGFEGNYTVLRIRHEGTKGAADDQSGSEQQHYRNEFELIPASTPYRPELVTPKPRIQGVLTALIDGQQGQYAYIDEEGRYRVKLFFDRSDKKEGQATKSVRMAQPYSGANYGMHFPLHTGTEVALGFTDGDPDRPIVLGSLPNPAKGSPVSSKNKSQNMMKSHTGNGILLEDGEGKTGVHINSTGGHKIGLDDSGGTKGITSSTSGGHSAALDDTNQKMEFKTTGGHTVVFDDAGQKIGITSTSGHKVTLDDAGGKVNITDGSGNTSLTMDTGGKITITSTSDISISTDANMDLSAGADININAKNINISSEVKGSVTGGAGLSLDGGPELNGKAIKIGFAADAQFKAEAPAVETSGQATNKMAGALIDISATGIAKIAGTMVNIN